MNGAADHAKQNLILVKKKNRLSNLNFSFLIQQIMQDKRPFESEKKNSVKEANNIHMYKYNAITSH